MNSSNKSAAIDYYGTTVRTLVQSYIIIMLSIIGIIFNSVICYIFWFKSLSYQSLNRFFAQLALMDLLTALSLIYNQVLIIINLTDRNMIPNLSRLAGTILCRTSAGLMILAMTNSNLTLAAISIDRYRAVMHPLALPLRRKTVTLIIIIKWLVTIGITTFLLIYYDLGSGFPYPCEISGSAYEVFAVTLAFAIIVGIIPISLIFICYGIVIKKILTATPPMDNSEYQRRQNLRIKQRNKSIGFILIITILTLPTSSLFLFIQIIIRTGDLIDFTYSSNLPSGVWVFYEISFTTSALPAVFNPILYNFVSTNFQKALISLIQDWKMNIGLRKKKSWQITVNGVTSV